MFETKTWAFTTRPACLHIRYGLIVLSQFPNITAWSKQIRQEDYVDSHSPDPLQDTWNIICQEHHRSLYWKGLKHFVFYVTKSSRCVRTQKITLIRSLNIFAQKSNRYITDTVQTWHVGSNNITVYYVLRQPWQDDVPPWRVIFYLYLWMIGNVHLRASYLWSLA